MFIILKRPDCAGLCLFIFLKVFSVELFQGQNKCLGSQAAFSGGFKMGVKLMYKNEARKVEVHGFGFFEGYFHVFDEVFDIESRIIIFFADSRTEVVNGPGTGCAFTDDVNNGLWVQA